MDFDLNSSDEDDDAPVAKVKDWDPPLHEREWHSHVQTGDRGWKVIRDGVDCMKYDRPNQDLAPPYKEGEWVKEEESRRMLPAEMGVICHAADQQFCLRMQLYSTPRKDWVDLSAEEKKRWCGSGPQHPARARLFNAIMEVLREEEVR